jgi:hypothetical protein
MDALLKKFKFEEGSPQIRAVSCDPRFLVRYSKEYVAEQACTNIKSIYTILERLVSGLHFGLEVRASTYTHRFGFAEIRYSR